MRMEIPCADGVGLARALESVLPDMWGDWDEAAVCEAARAGCAPVQHRPLDSRQMHQVPSFEASPKAARWRRSKECVIAREPLMVASGCDSLRMLRSRLPAPHPRPPAWGVRNPRALRTLVTTLERSTGLPTAPRRPAPSQSVGDTQRGRECPGRKRIRRVTQPKSRAAFLAEAGRPDHEKSESSHIGQHVSYRSMRR